jgi:hypothetical protein
MKHLAALAFLAATGLHAQSFRISNSDVAMLYNKHRTGQPKNTPWAGSYWAYASHGIAQRVGSQSPAAKYDRLVGGADSVEAWEKENHSCDAYTGETKESCEGWWGHCNAWSAAGIKEPEPRAALRSGGTELSVADQKALVTELWMDSGSLFVGNTEKGEKTADWIFDPRDSVSRRRLNYGTGNLHDAFWDVTPKTFFLVFTNYVGILKQGVVIDRFTGDEVWNQPVVGYRLLPLRAEDLLPAERSPSGASVHPVRFRVKIYWANDNVPEEHISQPFDIARTNDSEEIEESYLEPDYTGRYLEFKLFLDAPLTLEGTEARSSGRIVGQGIWGHQENPVPLSWANHTHPDFIWAPTQLDQFRSGQNGNPHIEESQVRALVRGGGTTRPSRASVTHTLSFRRLDLELEGGFDADAIKTALKQIFGRAGLRSVVSASKITASGRGQTQVNAEVRFPNGEALTQIKAVLLDSGVTLL